MTEPLSAEVVQLCNSDTLVNGGAGFRFAITYHGESAGAFLVRYQGQVRGFVNRCVHMPVELDWQSGQFFDATGHFLICSMHGYLYQPDNGRCANIQAYKRGLTQLEVFEQDGWVYWKPSQDIRPVMA